MKNRQNTLKYVLLLLFIFSKIGVGQNDSLLFTHIKDLNIVNDQLNTWSVCWVDYNNDGWDDLFLPSYTETQKNLLYENNGDGTFTPKNSFAFIDNNGTAVAASWADYDNDGYNDVLISENIEIGNYLYKNQCDGVFQSIKNVNLTDEGINSHGVSWADFDNDGFLDALTLEYNEIGTTRLYKNIKGQNFVEFPANTLDIPNGIAIGATWSDVNNDGYLDLFVPYDGDANYLCINNQNGSFTPTQMDDNAKSVGCSFADFDNDGDMDLFVSNASDENNFLYKNDGEGNFTLINNSPIVQDKGHSHGSCWGDFNNDGWLDLYVSNDRNNEKFLYFNKGDGTFIKDTIELITLSENNSFGVACTDYDHDGDLDLYVANHSNENNFFFVNNGNQNTWVSFRLTGISSNRNAIGSKIRLKANINGQSYWQVREISSQTGGGAGSQNSLNAHFGLGDANKIDSLVIEWSAGTTQVFTNIPSQQYYHIKEFSTDLNAPLEPQYLKCPNDELELCAISIYPNPASEQLAILANLPLEENERIRLEIFDAKGALIHFDQSLDPNQINYINLHNFANGIYIANVQSPSKSVLKKFLKN